MKYLVFDTETNDLPRNYKAPMTDLGNWPRVIQLAWIHYDATEAPIAKSNYLIKPNGWTMPTDKFWADHGFTQEKSLAEGIEITEALDLFIDQINQTDLLVAHNMSFDYNILGAEMIRAGKRANKRVARLCTMMASIDFCQIPGKYGYKYPKLDELYTKLFGTKFDDAHDAFADTAACAKCFFELLRRGIIKIPVSK